MDLPGTYSLAANSAEEEIARDSYVSEGRMRPWWSPMPVAWKGT